MKYGSGSPLPVLEIDSPADPTLELPDPAESWAWAHAQITGGLGQNETLDGVVQNQPERTLSRLICPRKLGQREGYHACVVPAFRAGVLAGLGLPVVGDHLEPAWDLETVQTPLRLPVYYHWEFMAGAAGDFESLVWLLQRRPPPEGLGQRPLEVKPVIYRGEKIGADPVPLQGALRAISPDPAHPPTLAGTGPGYRKVLRDLLNQGLGTNGWTLPEGMPVPPPAYGGWHAGQKSIPGPAVPDGPSNRAWLRALNLQVRNRAAAGLGAAVVQEHQEQLMASAWEQLGGIEKANQLLRKAQLAREASYQIYRQHLVKLPPEALAYMAGRALTRVMWGPETAHARVRGSKLPVAALEGAFRRLTRPRGPLAKRLGSNGKSLTGRLVAKLSNGGLRPVPPHPKPGGMFSDDDFKDRDKKIIPEGFPVPGALCDLTPEFLKNGGFIRVDDTGGDDRVPDGYRRFQSAAGAVQEGMPPCGADLERVLPPDLPLDELQTVLKAELDPRQTVKKRVYARLRLPPGWNPVDPLEPVMAYPVFPQPMYRELVKLSQDFLLPGVDRIPPNTITLLETNPEFVEAYLTGLNYEMARELLWRGFPTDQRGSYFRRFWDPAGGLKRPADPEEEADIQPIDRWDVSNPLGGNSLTRSAGSLAVLLICGDLMRRYPRAMIYGLKARWEQDDHGKDVRRPVPVTAGVLPGDDAYPEKYPIFQGTLPPDITFVGLPIPSDALVGDETDAGYFIVLQQQPTEPRYGLDETEQANRDSWDSLSWMNVATSAGGYIRLNGGLHPADGSGGPFPQPTNLADRDISWFADANSAHLAFITLQKPLRVLIHAGDLIGA